jgi:hypothetical protein
MMKYLKIITLVAGLVLCISTNNLYSQSFTVIDTLPDGAYGTAAWGDFDQDGFKDLAYLTQALPNTICKVYHNAGDGFTEVVQYFPYLFNPGACWGDLNNDGFDDLVVNGMDSVFHCRTFIYQSLGNGSFVSMPNTIFGLSAGSVDISDFNHDGWKDIAVTGNDSVGYNRAYIYKNLGSFQFTDIQAELYGIHFGEIKWGDYNHDDLPDLAINGIGNEDFRTRVYRNMGGDQFELQPFYMKGSGGTLDWADLDGDGWIDLVVTGYDSTSSFIFTEVHHNNGDGTFSLAPTNLPDFGEPSGVAIADYNEDERLDLCFIGGSSNFPFGGSALALNLNENVYNVEPFIHGNIINPILKSADIDSDGDYDMIFSNFILRNNLTTGTNDLPDSDTGINLYPNPARDKVFVESKDPLESIAIYDFSGKEVMRTKAPSSGNEVPLLQCKDGEYLVKTLQSNGKINYNKLIIIH